jgi:predicted dehydrogenase
LVFILLMSIRLAIIGCGKITQRLALPQLAACPDASIGALVDVNRGAAAAVAKTFGIDRRLIWTDWRRMLRQADVDAVAVCLPNDLHAEVTVAALKAGKHVLVEKPMALTLAEADRMIAASRTHRRVLMVEQTLRFEPAHEVAYALLRRGAIGPITQVRGRLGHAGPEYWSRTSSWFTQSARAGGGALMDVGIHILDLLRWLSGKEVARICCQVNTLRKRTRVEDNASALLEWTDGALGSFEVSWTTRPYAVTTEWYGARGTLRTRLGAAHPVTVEWGQASGAPRTASARDAAPAVPARSRRGGAYAEFLRCIRTGRHPLIDGPEGRHSLEVILAAYASARTGRWVTLPGRRR